MDTQQIKNFMRAVKLSFGFRSYDVLNRHYHAADGFEAFHQDEALRTHFIQIILEQCFEQKNSFLIIDSTNISMIGIYLIQEDSVILIGPVVVGSTSRKSMIASFHKLHYDDSEIQRATNDILNAPKISMSDVERLINIVSGYLNCATDYYSLREHIIYKKDQQVTAHLPAYESTDMAIMSEDSQIDYTRRYMQEIRLCSCVENGQLDDLNETLNYELDHDQNENDLHNRQESFAALAIVVSRAAIHGGMDVTLALRLQNFYIQKGNHVSSFETLDQLHKEMLYDYTQRVCNLHRIDAYTETTKRIMRYVERHLHSHIDYEDMAEYTQKSRNYMMSKFKQETKMSVVDFCTYMKVEEAKLLLNQTNMSIVEVSEELCFSSQSFFTANFRRLEGMTPTEYRKISRNNSKQIK